MSNDGQPDEAQEWEDYEGREQDMYPEDLEQEARDVFFKKHGMTSWQRKFGLSNNEEDNLVMDEMEREGYRDE